MVSPIRLSGIASGMDTEKMIKDLMKAQRAPLNKLLQKKQLEEWKRDDYRSMNSLLLELRTKTSNMRLQSTYLQKQATSENTAAVEVKTKGTPGLTSYSIKVVSLAQPATAASVKTTTTSADATTQLGAGNDFNLTVTGSAGSKVINITSTDSINSVLSKINAVSAQTGIKAAYLADDKTITFTSTTSGSSTISFSGAPAGNALGITNGSTTSGTAGTPGSVIINGVTHSINSNTFTYDGLEFTVKQTTATAVGVTVSPDEDAIFDAIKGFVDKYNEVIEKIDQKTSEPRYRDYKPLLDEEREQLTEKQIEQWEEKARSGNLRQDTILNSALFDARRALYTPVSGVSDTDFDTLSEIGITTGSYVEKGKLYIDESKLRKAISENGTQVMDLFTKTSTSSDKTTKYNESGLAVRLYDALNASIDKITEKAGSSGLLSDNSLMSKSIRNINKDILTWEDRLQKIEDRYWRQFTAMENALQKLNAQSAQLAQTLGGGGQ
jgi:flagellar hook-associated protein 2